MPFDLSIWTVLDRAGLALAILSIPSVLLQRRARPMAAAVWILVLLLVPLAGVGLWWLMGRTHLERKRRRRRTARAQVTGRLAGLLADLNQDPPEPDEAADEAEGSLPGVPLVETLGPRAAARQMVLSTYDGVFPSRGGNRVEMLVDAVEFYPALEAAIREARHHVHFQFYIFQADATGARFRDLLCERAAAGVEVRVLVDAVGGSPIAGRFMEPLRRAGGKVAAFLPVRFLRRRINFNFRNHRKIVVVDGAVAFTGGFNVGDEYTRDWHDLALRIGGPVVDQFQEVFTEDWYFVTGEDLVARAYFGRYHEPVRRLTDGLPRTFAPQPARCRVVASGPDTLESATHEALFLSITTAADRIWIMTPYFIPDQAILVALRTAARRGVDVQIILPRRSDVPFVRIAARSYYEQLLSAGVRIFEYDAAILHAKMLLFDDDWCVVGSANVDIRSFRLNFEANCYLYGSSLNAVMATQFVRDRAQSIEITMQEVNDRSRFEQLKEAVAHLFSPLL